MHIGHLRNLVEIWEFTTVQDDYGQPQRTYTKLTDAWAEIRPLTGKENFYENMEVTSHTHKILMRFIPLPIDSTMQIRYGGRTFEVVGSPANWMERNIHLTFNVKEVFEKDKSI